MKPILPVYTPTQVVSEASEAGAKGILHHCHAPRLVQQVCDILTGDKSAKLRKHVSGLLLQVGGVRPDVVGAVGVVCCLAAAQGLLKVLTCHRARRVVSILYYVIASCDVCMYVFVYACE